MPPRELNADKIIHNKQKKNLKMDKNIKARVQKQKLQTYNSKLIYLCGKFEFRQNGRLKLNEL